MEFSSVVQGCPVHVTIEYRNQAPVIQGRVYPFEGGSDYVDFSVAQNLDIRMASGTLVMVPTLRFPKQGYSFSDTDMAVKAVTIAQEQMRYYHALLGRFTDIEAYTSALFEAARRNDEASMAKYLMLCPLAAYTNPQALDQVLLTLLMYKPPIKLRAKETPMTIAMRQLLCQHRDFEFEGSFTTDDFFHFLREKNKEFKLERKPVAND